MNEFGTGASIRGGALVALMMATMIAAGCKGGGGGASQAASATPTSSTPAPTAAPSPTPSPDPAPTPVIAAPGNNTPPAISASPTASIDAGASYALTPNVQDPDGDTLAFSVQNRPAWAQFSTVTGELVGTPTAAHAGSYDNIVISVSDGKATAALQPFSIVVTPGAESGVTLQWEMPTQTADGAPLGELAGFRIHYGKKEEVLPHTIEIANPGLASYVVDDLPAGTYYFAVRAVATSGDQSSLSNVIRKVIG